jgi:hypothetical protein
MKIPQNITLLGDIHGDWCVLKQKCAAVPERTVVGIGDVGIGFVGKRDPVLPGNFRFFRGNHDNPEICRAHPQYIHDYGMWNDMFVVAGADSIDKGWRTAGVDWWPDEQLGLEQCEEALRLYREAKPQIVITHEAPSRMHAVHVAASVTHNPARSQWGGVRPTSTGLLLEQMMVSHAPRFWFHGHWHNPLMYRLHKTTFVCLGINGTFDLTEENLKLLQKI